MNVILDMADIIELLNGRAVKKLEGTDVLSLQMQKEDTSISKKGAIERIAGEWEFTLKEERPI